MADRARPRRGGGSAGPLLPGRSLLLGALGQGADADDKQHLQRLAHGRRLARQVIWGAVNELENLRSGGCLCISGCLMVPEPASAQKHGGILKMYMADSPASMSIHEEAAIY